MKRILNFELALMKLNIRDVFYIMQRDHDCDCPEILSLSEIMKTYCLTDFCKSRLYSEMERDATSCDY